MTYFVQLVGASFRPAEARDIVRTLEIGEEVGLERDPNNPHDANAVLVIADNMHIGFVARDDAAVIAPLLDAGETFSARVDSRSGPLKVGLEITPATL